MEVPQVRLCLVTNEAFAVGGRGDLAFAVAATSVPVIAHWSMLIFVRPLGSGWRDSGLTWSGST
jgi:hypothetical protein